MNVSRPYAQLVNTVAQKISFRPPQFVPELRQALDPNDAFVSHLYLKLIHPDQQWRRTIFCCENHNLRLRHIDLNINIA